MTLQPAIAPTQLRLLAHAQQTLQRATALQPHAPDHCSLVHLGGCTLRNRSFSYAFASCRTERQPNSQQAAAVTSRSVHVVCAVLGSTPANCQTRRCKLHAAAACILQRYTHAKHCGAYLQLLSQRSCTHKSLSRKLDARVIQQTPTILPHTATNPLLPQHLIRLAHNIRLQSYSVYDSVLRCEVLQSRDQ